MAAGIQPFQTHGQASAALRQLGDPAKGEFLKGFFKCGPGQYGEGDRFLGIPMPVLRQFSRHCFQLSLQEIEALLYLPHNEERFLGLLLLVRRYDQGDEPARQAVFDCYLKNRRQANNWNLVDGSAPYIPGVHLLQRDRALLFRLAQSDYLWERRIAIVSTLGFIRAGDCGATLKLTERLLQDPHDLMHKACGWMLREVGKRDQARLENFLDRHGSAMPRTMLRYAIERFSPKVRQSYLKHTRG